MRHIFLLLTLIFLVRGEWLQKGNCSASSEVLEVTLEYSEASEVSVDWRLPKGVAEDCVSSYNVCVSLAEVSSEPQCMNTTNTYWGSISMQPCSNYSLVVVALGQDDEQLTRGSTTFFTAPAEVSGYRVNETTSTSLLVTWQATEGNSCVQRYVLSWRNETATESRNLTASDTSYEVTGLDPCTRYTVSIAGVTADGVETSQDISTYTAAQGAPLPVDKVNMSLASQSTASVQWQQTSYCIQAYRVCMGVVDGAEAGNCSLVPGDQLQWTSPADLQPCTNYSIAVWAIDFSGSHSSPENITVATGPGEVADLSVTGRSADSMTVSWSRPHTLGNTCLHSYEVYTCVDGQSDKCDTLVATLGSGVHSHVIPDLHACEVYDVVVKTVNPEGTRSYGTSISSYTDVADQNGVLGNFNSDTDFYKANTDYLVLEASWDLPDSTDCLAGYRLCYDDVRYSGNVKCYNMSVADVTWSSSDVEYCSEYRVQVEPVTRSGAMYPQVHQDVYTPPSMVSNLTVWNVTGTSIQVGWTAPPAETSACLQSYGVHWCESGAVGCNVESDSTQGETLHPNETMYTIHGLKNCTTYLFWVVSLGAEADSEPTFFYTKAGGGAPGKVGDLRTVQQTCGSMLVEWSEPLNHAQCVSNYTLCWKEDSNGSQTCETISSVPDTRYEITSLRPETAYNITVAALGAGGEMSELSVVRANTRDITQVRKLTIANTTETSIVVSWSNPEENARCAEQTIISWCNNEPGSPPSSSCRQSGSNSTSVLLNVTQLEVTELLPCSNYTISVNVRAAGNSMSPSSTASTRTSYESPVGVGELRQLNTNSTVTVSWDAPQQSPTCKAGYYVCWEEQGMLSDPVCGHSATESYKFNLTACKLYTASVRSVITDGSMSAAAKITLDLATPGEIRNLTVASESTDTVLVSWAPPLNNLECVENYTLCFTLASGGDTQCEMISGDSNQHSIPGLQPNSQYNVTLTALGPEGRQSVPIAVHAATSESPNSNGGRASVVSLRYWSSVLAFIAMFLLTH